jgi:lipocalin-like protein
MRDRPQLVGTWRMLTWRREFADTGEQIDALGADPVGFVSYGADSRVHAIVVKRDRSSPARLPPSDSEKLELFDSMLAYAGTFGFEKRVGDDLSMVSRIASSWRTNVDLSRP